MYQDDGRDVSGDRVTGVRRSKALPTPMCSVRNPKVQVSVVHDGIVRWPDHTWRPHSSPEFGCINSIRTRDYVQVRPKVLGDPKDGHRRSWIAENGGC
jgi:hypothetical protein